MKIISKFKDGYDSVAQYGFDPDNIFVRETKEEYTTTVPKAVSEVVRNFSKGDYDERVYYIFFCGRVFPILWENMGGMNENGYGSFNDYIKEQQYRLEHRELNRYPQQGFFADKDKIPSWRGFQYAFTEKGLLALEEDLKQIKIPNEVFIEMGCPYFLIYKDSDHRGSYNIIKNPQLSKYAFFKFMDAFTTFQEVAMFNANFLLTVDQMPITTGSDKVIAQQKGFDEMSFRTQAPGKKKENRKINRAKKKGLIID